jgi:CRISPR-associated endonuclease Cas1
MMIPPLDQNKSRLPAWEIVAGYGTHIKATRDYLTIQEKGKIREISLDRLDHLMIIGGHTIQTSALTTLLSNRIFVSFFKSDGEPAGYLQPYGYHSPALIGEMKAKIPPFRYALSFARYAIKERMLAIEKWNEEISGGILYKGELDILNQAACELDNLIKIEEILRVSRLIGDMYYEIMSRMVHDNLNFKRRTNRPYKDPVNAILSFGYAMLTSTCTKFLIAAHLDPDDGMLNRGKGSLSLDFADCYKTRMIDSVVLSMLLEEKITRDSYDIGEKRCILAEPLIKCLVPLFKSSIREGVVSLQVQTFVRALLEEGEFEIHRF